MQLPPGEVLENPDFRREALYKDESTWFAETLNGVMSSEFGLVPKDGEIYDQEGRSLGKVFADSLEHARAVGRFNPDLAFEIDRNEEEWREYQDILAMALGDGPNTIIVVSELPHALMNETQDVLGYKVERKLGFLRVISRQEDGSLLLRSHSLDQSDRLALEAIYETFGIKPMPGELLGQRIKADLSPPQQKGLINQLVKIYDSALSERLGGVWRAGRSDEDIQNTWEFVLSQQDLLNNFVDLAMRDPTLAETMRYDYAAAFEERWDKRYAYSGGIVEIMPEYQESRLIYEIINAGGRAREQGKVYSGCGNTLNGQDELSLGDQLEQAGYSKSKKDTKTMYCVTCPKPTCRTFHDKLEPVGGYYHCKNPKCGHRVKA